MSMVGCVGLGSWVGGFFFRKKKIQNPQIKINQKKDAGGGGTGREGMVVY